MYTAIHCVEFHDVLEPIHIYRCEDNLYKIDVREVFNPLHVMMYIWETAQMRLPQLIYYTISILFYF